MRAAGLLYGFSLPATFAQHLNPVELDDMIRAHGGCGELRRAVVCSCRRVETGMARGVCPSCRGLGWTYPVELRTQTMAMNASRNAMSRDLTPGALTDGTVQSTFLSEVVPGRGDVWLPCGDVMVVQESFKRALNQVPNQEVYDGLLTQRRTNINVPQSAASERLRYGEGAQIEVVAYSDGDQVTRIAHEGADYVVRDATVEWLPSRGPAPGEGYTVRYLAPAGYMIGNSAPAFRSEGGQRIPHRCTMQRLDRLSDADLR